MPDWAWAKYLAPITGMDDTLSKYLPSVVGKWNGQTYSFGVDDVALAMFARKSVLTANNIRIPDINKPWTADEFAAALKTLKASGKFQYALDMQTASTGELVAGTPIPRNCRASAVTSSTAPTTSRRPGRSTATPRSSGPPGSAA